jgi:hypothetical protein
MLAPYEYTDSLNQRQIWEPFLTGRERQEFDSHLRVRYIHEHNEAFPQALSFLDKPFYL